MVEKDARVRLKRSWEESYAPTGSVGRVANVWGEGLYFNVHWDDPEVMKRYSTDPNRCLFTMANWHQYFEMETGPW